MLENIVGILLILAGVAWAVMCNFGAMMASRQVDYRREVLRPASWSLVPIGLGILLLVY